MAMTDVEYEIVVARPTGCDDMQLFHRSNIGLTFMIKILSPN
jgi:hypothetical protein